MNNRETDISLLKKYVKGELDAHAMHQLELRAQADPFLMDAIEGYEKAGVEQQQNIADLSHRLNKRVSFKEKRIIPWRYITAAASVVLVIGIGGTLLYLHQPAARPAIATNLAPPVSAPLPAPKQAAKQKNRAEISGNVPPAVISPNNVARHRPNQYTAATSANAYEKSSSRLGAEQPAAPMADTTPVDEMVVMGMQEKKKKDAERIVALPDPKAKKPASTPSDQLVKSKVEGVSITNQDQTGARQYYTAGIVQGRVVEKGGGQPMPGVSIRIKGTSIGTQTDASGSFKLPSGNKDKTLVVGYIGYQTQEVPAAKLDSSRTLAMVANNGASLNEVVVTRNSTEENQENGEADVTAPHPAAGWDNYNKYLKKNAISPDKKAGIVKLAFTVSPNGTITDVHVIKSLSIAADKKAVELVINGPGWAPGSDANAKVTSISIKFETR